MVTSLLNYPKHLFSALFSAIKVFRSAHIKLYMYADTYLSVTGQKSISQALKRLYSMKLYHTGQVVCYIRLALQLFFQKVITLCFSVIIKILPSLVKRRVCPFLFSGSDLFHFAACLVACFHLFSALFVFAHSLSYILRFPACSF